MASFLIRENVPLAPLTTFMIGGRARFFVEIRTAREIREALNWAKEHNTKFILLAGGSNVLVPDEGLNALVAIIKGCRHSFAGQELRADSGCNLLELIHKASSRGYGGWEKLSGIPGTIGGAIRGNAGAFGTEIKDVATKIRAVNIISLNNRKFSNVECDFSYRHSFFKDNPEWFITRVIVVLTPIDAYKSARLIEKTIAGREKRHLQNVRAAGSYFMNPTASRELQKMFEKEKNSHSRGGRVPAGWLIEKAGLKGAIVGGAQASPQHPNYIVNIGKASAADVIALANEIKAEVKRQFNVELKEEAVVLTS